MMKNALAGVALALAAAYVFMSLFFLALACVQEGGRDECALNNALVVGFVGVRMAYWFAVPLGAALGVIIPRLFARRGALASFFGGALLGAVFGFAGGLMINYTYVSMDFGFLTLFCTYCALWAGVYACCARRGGARNVVAATTGTD